MRSEYSYVLTETAESDLNRITEYLVRELRNPEAAPSLFHRCIMELNGKLSSNSWILFLNSCSPSFRMA